uniref:Uncharacterized protein n=1 Tax=Aegilops tauschii subsp. strangulata TaxID=200361 RepID=A0A453H9H2_AEGTS
MESKFFRFLKLVGVGFKARTEQGGRELFLKLGYSHEGAPFRGSRPKQ